MRILIIAATRFEIQQSIDFFQVNSSAFPHHSFSFLITGVGAVPTTYSLTKEVDKNKADLVIQAGLAGCFDNRNLTDTVIIKEDSFADLGVMENNSFKTVFDLNLAGENEFPYTDAVLVNPNKKLLDILPLEKLTAITVNEITTVGEKIKWYKQKYRPVVESMEGAAFHYVCLQENIPFVQLRSISNYIGERDKSKWKLKEAIASLNKNLLSVTEEILKKNEV
ncbi:MAG TPA: futalosine hydrolase [Puia sp.]|nr:futalosine hydrolase [Puia sp.]